MYPIFIKICHGGVENMTLRQSFNVHPFQTMAQLAAPEGESDVQHVTVQCICECLNWWKFEKNWSSIVFLVLSYWVELFAYWDDHLLWLKQQHFRPQRWYCILVEFSWSEVIELREKTPWLCFDCGICRLAELHHQAAVIRQDFVIPGHTVTWDGA